MSTGKKPIITIGGRPGSGKSTTAKGVAKLLHFTHFSSGDLFREVSKQQGQTVLQANQEAEKVDGISTIDQLVDQKLRDIGNSKSDIVIDSRMAWHWIPDSFRIFLDLDTKTAASRILKDMTPERIAVEHIPEDIDEYARQLDERFASESRRYNKMYNADPYNITNYDLVIDTKANDLETVIQQVIKAYQDWIA
jgi:cytidylate kinase